MLLDVFDSFGFECGGDDKFNVFVVDDDFCLVEIIVNYLQLLGCLVICIYGGRDGVVIVLKLQLDLIVFDLMMLDMFGFEVVEVFKSDSCMVCILVLVVMVKQIVDVDCFVLNGYVMQIIEKLEFNYGCFVSEVRCVMGLV